jgi:EAL domain-containing protein (putative c-di-GMP-specific phosphodiesterase class I)
VREVTVPFRGAAPAAGSAGFGPALAPIAMLKWDSVNLWRRRASDGAAAPVSPLRDLLLEAVISHEQVNLLFQPLIDARSGRIVGAEALARSTVTRDAESLFARAQSARLGERLSRLVQRKALRCAAVWEGPLKGLKVSINLLPADISRAGYEFWLLDEIDAAAIDPKRVTLEITESALLRDLEAAAPRLAELRRMGVRIAIDDFGTGYSSLAYLSHLEVDILKIDKSFVDRVTVDRQDAAITETIITMGRSLNLLTIAEGVEYDAQAEWLRAAGCHVGQGYVWSRPVDRETLERCLATGFPTHTSVTRSTAAAPTRTS